MEVAKKTPKQVVRKSQKDIKISNSDKIKIKLMTVPAIVLYTIFLVVPIIMAVYFSFSEWNGIAGTPLKFVGIKNYIAAFQDELFLISLKNLSKMLFFSVIFHTPIALLLAVALHQKIKGKRFFKIIFFVPTIFPLTAIGLLWYFIFMPNGSLNTLLETIGLGNLVTGWLINPKTAMPTIIFVNIWAGIGYYMIILLAGLKGIPEDLYEAAKIDGATSIQSFFKITIPMLKPIIGLCLVLDIIGTIKIFDLVFVMTGGGPNGLTNLPTTLVYYQAFLYDNYGLGSAIGIILLIITILVTGTGNYILKFAERRRNVNG